MDYYYLADRCIVYIALCIRPVRNSNWEDFPDKRKFSKTHKHDKVCEDDVVRQSRRCVYAVHTS